MNPETRDPRPEMKAESSAVWRQVAGYAIALLCLLWVFHDVDFGVLRRSAASLDWQWVVAAVLLDMSSYACQGWRWSLLLRPLGNLTPLRSTQAVYAGLFLNEVLPFRVGELARLFLAGRWTNQPFARVIPSIAVERLFDGIWLALGIGVTAMVVPLPRNLLDAADIFGLLILISTALFVWLVMRRGTGAQPVPPRGPLARLMNTLAGGLREIGFSRAVWASFLLSFFFLFLQAMAFWAVMRAAGLPLSLWAGLAVLLIVHLGTAIPNAPANVGSYQFFVVAGLLLFGVDKQSAAGFSVVVFVILTVPLWALGWLALRGAGFELAAMRRELRAMRQR